MAEVIKPSWGDLRDLIGTAENKLTVCTPYYSESGIEVIFDHFQETASLEFWTTLSPSDWLNGMSDPEALLALLELFSETHPSVELFIHQRLHAKVYIADNSIALVGSANLSEGGFARKFELMVRLQEMEEINQAYALLTQERGQNARILAINDLEAWITENIETINRSRVDRTNEPDRLADVQRALDTMLGYGGTGERVLDEPSNDNLSAFVEWLRRHPQLSGANVLLSRFENLDHQNLTGHFRQSFFACWRFFSEYPQFKQLISGSFLALGENDLFQPSAEVAQAWLQHIDNHATDLTDDYNYSTLRGILPPSYGGTRLGGGGGISTLKRMLGLLALFLQE